MAVEAIAHGRQRQTSHGQIHLSLGGDHLLSLPNRILCRLQP